MKAIVFSRRFASPAVVIHPVIERVFEMVHLAFDEKSLEVAFQRESIDACLVGSFSVPHFLEVERGCSMTIPDAFPCLIGSMKAAEILESDARVFGFAGALSVGGSVDETGLRADFARTKSSPTCSRHMRSQCDLAKARRAFGVLYIDPIDLEIGNLVSIGMADRDIANLVHVAPQTVRNRISAILDRSRLVNRTDLAVHHRDCAVRLWIEADANHDAARTSVR